MVEAVINITQYETDDQEGNVRQFLISPASQGNARQLTAGASSSSNATHLPPVTQPMVRQGLSEWETEDEEDWSDSPTNQPNLLYRNRFSWGRDERELFSYRGLTPLDPLAEGARLGSMDNSSGLLTYFRDFPISSSVSLKLFKVSNLGRVKLLDFNVQNEFEHLYELGKITGEADLEQFPFLLVAAPEPFSIKNPIDSDVFIRLSNYTFPIASGTISLFLDDVQQFNLTLEEFFTGLGGFDVTWNNTFNFDYDAQVDVRWEFRDTDIPANRVVIAYPFYTVPDSAGPRVRNLIPADQATGFAVNGSIQFDLEDFESDVNIDSLVVYVNNVQMLSGDNATIQTFRLENQKGYTVRITPNEPWLYGDLIPVAIFVEDVAVSRNRTFFTYSFTTEESLAPRMINVRPLVCSIDIPVGTDVSVDVIDGGHGLDKDSLVFSIDEVERTGVIQLIPVIHRDD